MEQLYTIAKRDLCGVGYGLFWCRGEKTDRQIDTDQDHSLLWLACCLLRNTICTSELANGMASAATVQ